MGGVDLHDQMMSYYRMAFKSRKYFLRLIFHMIDMCVVNCWLLYRRSQDSMNIKRHQQDFLSEFKQRLSTSLMSKGKNPMKKRGRPSHSNVEQQHARKKNSGHATKPLMDVRTDGIGHFPQQAQTRGRCKYPGCKGKISMTCIKCKVYLCCEKNRNCFIDFHTK